MLGESPEEAAAGLNIKVSTARWPPRSAQPE